MCPLFTKSRTQHTIQAANLRILWNDMEMTHSSRRSLAEKRTLAKHCQRQVKMNDGGENNGQKIYDNDKHS